MSAFRKLEDVTPPIALAGAVIAAEVNGAWRACRVRAVGLTQVQTRPVHWGWRYSLTVGGVGIMRSGDAIGTVDTAAQLLRDRIAKLRRDVSADVTGADDRLDRAVDQLNQLREDRLALAAEAAS